MSTPRIVECTLPLQRPDRQKDNAAPPPERARAHPKPVVPGRVPRIARHMALALHFEQLLRAGKVRDYVELATLGHVSRARITQLMNLLLLAPDLQEQILYLPPVETGRDPIHLSQLQALTGILDWPSQRRMWQQLQRRSSE
jgi:hypothetical protein